MNKHRRTDARHPTQSIDQSGTPAQILEQGAPQCRLHTSDHEAAAHGCPVIAMVDRSGLESEQENRRIAGDEDGEEMSHSCAIAFPQASARMS